VCQEGCASLTDWFRVDVPPKTGGAHQRESCSCSREKMKAAFESSMIHDVLGDDVDPGDADYDDDDYSTLSSSAASSWCCRPS
jgi:hypothetical protein